VGVTFATIVVYLAFWSVWPVATWIITAMVLAALLGFLYGVGKAMEDQEASSQQRGD